MRMEKTRLIAIDLDGTLLDRESRIPERNGKAVADAMKRGIGVTLCTGRMFRSTRAFAEALSIELPLVCYNGAMIRDPKGSTRMHAPLSASVAKRALAMFRERGVYVQSYIDDVLYIRDADDAEFRNYTTRYGVPGTAVGDALFDPPSPPTKLLAVAANVERARIVADEIAGALGADAYVTRSNSEFVEVMNPSVNKAHGLSSLAREMGVRMDEVMAIGDGENDTEMISSAGIGIAMSNGCLKAKTAARDIAPANYENGVAWAIEKYALFRG